MADALTLALLTFAGLGVALALMLATTQPDERPPGPWRRRP